MDAFYPLYLKHAEQQVHFGLGKTKKKPKTFFIKLSNSPWDTNLYVNI